jgi:hypothetical protein
MQREKLMNYIALCLSQSKLNGVSFVVSKREEERNRAHETRVQSEPGREEGEGGSTGDSAIAPTPRTSSSLPYVPCGL